MAAWPGVGKLLADGYGIEPGSAVLRTEMDSGPAKQTRVRGTSSHQRSCTYLMTAAERAAWVSWFRDDISRGAEWFDWPDPDGGATRQARIVDGQYSEQPHRGTLAWWYIKFSLETLE